MYKTIHHQACTGGTLISKTITAMRSVVLLSEINPNGRFTGSIHFEPTNLVTQYCKRFGNRNEEFRFRYFSDQLGLILDDCANSSVELVLRDHCHNEYMSKELYRKRKPLIEGIKYYHARRSTDEACIKSVLTVRHPLDSFLSCMKKGWVNKIDSSLDTYCERYIKFLDDYLGNLVVKYEDFCTDTENQLKLISSELDFEYDSAFIDTFYEKTLTGDSGRTSDVIRLPKRRDVPSDVKDLALKSSSYIRLCERLNYELL